MALSAQPKESFESKINTKHNNKVYNHFNTQNIEILLTKAFRLFITMVFRHLDILIEPLLHKI